MSMVPLKPFKLARSATRFMLALFVAVMLTVIMMPMAHAQFMAQFTAFPSTSTSSNGQVLGWNPSQPYACGRLRCSDVILQGAFGPNFTLAKRLEPGESEADVDAAVEDRVSLVKSTFASVLQTVLAQRLAPLSLAFQPQDAFGGPRDRPFYRDRIRQQFAEYQLFGHSQLNRLRVNSRHLNTQTDRSTSTALHPDTPSIEVGIENDQTVVFVTAQPEWGLAAQTLVTVTEFDLLNTGIQTKEDLAQLWRDIMRQRLSDALWGQDYDQQYPFDRLGFMVGIIMATIGLMWVFTLVQRLLRTFRRQLRNQFKTLQNALVHDLESVAMEGPMTRETDGAGGALDPGATGADGEHVSTPPPLPSVGVRFQNTVKTQVRQFLHHIQTASLDQQQNKIRQRRNLLQLLSRSLFWVQVVLIFTGATLMTLVFPASRLYATFFLTQAIALPTIWMAVSIADIVIDFFSDRYLHQWVKRAQIDNPSSHRYALRVSTYSPAIQGATTIMFMSLGLYLTIRALGIDPTVLASAGVAAVVVAFLSRNLLEDMLNGALILWTDRYAVGDVIKVGDTAGLVENMTLYITQIRGAEGRLVTIPNSQIRIVENLTKDWSRVDFKIEIAHNADIGKALEIIQDISDRMLEEDPWSDRILEPASILGIDQVSHAGILIQVWIKTQPMQQWSVGREFRLRIKQAFDQAGIGLGAPQRAIIYPNSLPFPRPDELDNHSERDLREQTAPVDPVRAD